MALRVKATIRARKRRDEAPSLTALRATPRERSAEAANWTSVRAIAVAIQNLVVLRTAVLTTSRNDYRRIEVRETGQNVVDGWYFWIKRMLIKKDLWTFVHEFPETFRQALARRFDERWLVD